MLKPGSDRGRVFGQAVVEYLLMVVVAMALVGVLTQSLKKSVLALWAYYIQQTSAPCPGCSTNPNYRFR